MKTSGKKKKNQVITTNETNKNNNPFLIDESNATSKDLHNWLVASCNLINLEKFENEIILAGTSNHSKRISVAQFKSEGSNFLQVAIWVKNRMSKSNYVERVFATFFDLLLGPSYPTAVYYFNQFKNKVWPKSEYHVVTEEEKIDSIIKNLILYHAHFARNGSFLNNQEGWYGFTALHQAVKYGYIDIVKLLLNNKADITLKALDGKTALHVAVEKDHTEICQLLISSKADVNVQDDAGNTPLHLAANKKDTKLFNLLIQTASPNFSIKNKQGKNIVETVLTNSDKKACLDLFNSIIDYTKNNQPPSKDINPTLEELLFFAASYGLVSCLQKLINMNIPLGLNKHGYTAYFAAYYDNQTETMELLEKQEVDLIDPAGNNALHRSITYRNHALFVKFILLYPSININAQNHRAETPLLLAVRLLDEVIRFEDQPLSSKEDVLQRLDEEDRKRLVKNINYLLEHKEIKVDAQNAAGNNILHLMATSKYTSLLKESIERINNQTLVHMLKQVNKAGETPEQLAKIAGNSQFLDIISVIRARLPKENIEINSNETQDNPTITAIEQPKKSAAHRDPLPKSVKEFKETQTTTHNEVKKDATATLTSQPLSTIETNRNHNTQSSADVPRLVRGIQPNPKAKFHSTWSKIKTKKSVNDINSEKNKEEKSLVKNTADSVASHEETTITPQSAAPQQDYQPDTRDFTQATLIAPHLWEKQKKALSHAKVIKLEKDKNIQLVTLPLKLWSNKEIKAAKLNELVGYYQATLIGQPQDDFTGIYCGGSFALSHLYPLAKPLVKFKDIDLLIVSSNVMEAVDRVIEWASDKGYRYSFRTNGVFQAVYVNFSTSDNGENHPALDISFTTNDHFIEKIKDRILTIERIFLKLASPSDMNADTKHECMIYAPLKSLEDLIKGNLQCTNPDDFIKSPILKVRTIGLHYNIRYIVPTIETATYEAILNDTKLDKEANFVIKMIKRLDRFFDLTGVDKGIELLHQYNLLKQTQASLTDFSEMLKNRSFPLSYVTKIDDSNNEEINQIEDTLRKLLFDLTTANNLTEWHDAHQSQLHSLMKDFLKIIEKGESQLNKIYLNFFIYLHVAGINIYPIYQATTSPFYTEKNEIALFKQPPSPTKEEPKLSLALRN